MVEGGAQVVPENEILEALFAGHDAIQPLLQIQEELRRAIGKPKREVPLAKVDQNVVRRVHELAHAKLEQALDIPEKLERYKRLAEVKSDVVPQALAEFPDKQKDIKGAFEELKRDIFRGLVIHQERRIDGRGLKDIRPITCEVEVLPRTHGSALFTRGETQALVVTTLGTSSDEQRVDALVGEHFKKFMLHYNFPPFSVGEVKFLRGPGRREIGHGNLAERALVPVLPQEESFPYTVRIVSEILESNGSTSMAIGVRRLALANGCGRAGIRAGRRHRHGLDQGRRACPRALRYPRRRRSFGRHGFQSCRHGRWRHVAADGYQDQRRQSRDHGPGACTRPRKAGCIFSAS